VTITVHIDLSLGHGGVRHQGNRTTCLAFVMSDLNGHRHARPALLSPEFLYREAALRIPGWKPNGGLQVAEAIAAVAMPGQPLESQCTYQATEPSIPLAANASYAPMFPGSYLSLAPSMTNIKAALSNGQSVGLIIKLTSDFFNVDPTTAQVRFSNLVLPNERHAVLVVGCGVDSASQVEHLLVRNSWGAQWGDHGHAWIPESYLAAHGICAIGG
jgi:hypothetical protein